MTVADDLKRSGLEVGGSPPTVDVVVAGRRVKVRIDDASGTVELSAVTPMPPGAKVDLRQASHNAPGDTSFSATPTGIEATRSLATPAIGVLYDAVFDLAKALTSLQLYAETFAALDAAAARTAPAPAGPPRVASTQMTVTVAANQSLTAGDGSVVGTLVPGRSYVAGRSEGGWIEVTDERGVKGWVAESAVRRV